MFFIKRELIKNWYIVILGMLVTAFVFSVSMVLFSLSSSVKDNHVKELQRENPDGIQLQLSKEGFEKFSDIPYDETYQFVIFTTNSLEFHMSDDTVIKNNYIEELENTFEYINYGGIFIQVKDILPRLIQKEFEFIEKSRDPSNNPEEMRYIYLSEAFATYLNASIDDEIQLAFLDQNDQEINAGNLIDLKISGIYETSSSKYDDIHYFITTTDVNTLYEPYESIFSPAIIVNNMTFIYQIYQNLEANDIIFEGLFGFSDYLEMNQNMSVIFLILSMIILFLGTLLLLHITFLIIKNRMPWISMVKSLGLSSLKIVLIYIIVMQFILLVSCTMSVFLAYLINRRITYLAELILNYQFSNDFNSNHFMSIYVIAFCLVSMLSFIIYKYIRKHSATELNRAEI
ncbi:MAG: FtsX-like permease family protein [Bacillota bacterium]|nr:MAG: FtsX-like permease family protein [Bacillota bacterium]